MQYWVKTQSIVSLPQQALFEMLYCFGVKGTKSTHLRTSVMQDLFSSVFFLKESWEYHALTKPQLHRISITKYISYVAKWFSLTFIDIYFSRLDWEFTKIATTRNEKRPAAKTSSCTVAQGDVIRACKRRGTNQPWSGKTFHLNALNHTGYRSVWFLIYWFVIN